MAAGTTPSCPPASGRHCPENRQAAISPIRGQGLLNFEGDCVVRERIDVVFPVLHGENGEDGTIQGLLQLAGIPYVGPHVAASAVAMDKTLTKLVADNAGIPQASWQLVRRGSLDTRLESTLDALEKRFTYPMFVKPAGTGSSVGVSKAKNRQSLAEALANAAKFDDKVLVEEFIRGKEIEVAVMGNESPVASVCGEIDSGVEFYDYDAKYITDTSVAYIPARISEEASEQVRDMAVKVYQRHWLSRPEPCGLLRDGGGQGGIQRDQYHPRLYLHFHVSQAFWRQWDSLRSAHQSAAGAGAGGLSMEEQKVLLSVRGRQTYGDQEPDTIELVTEGTMVFRDGGWDISYEETALTGMEGVTTTFRVEPGKVTLLRTGKLNSTMVFQENVAHDSLYQLEFGALLMTVKATRVFYDLVPDGGMVDSCL